MKQPTATENFNDGSAATHHSPAALHVADDMSEARLAMLMNDASIDQIFALDLGLKITAWNRACEQIHGVPREAAIGKLFTSVAAGVTDYPYIMEGLEAALKGLKSFVPSEKGAYRGGYFEHHFIPLKSGSGVIGVLVVIHDVAHRIKAEQELQRLNAQLEQKAKELRSKTEEIATFNHIASHDLKEPLRKIYTFVEMVATQEGNKISDAARSNLRRAQSAAQRMGLLTDDIATFAQVASPSEKPAIAGLQAILTQSLTRHQRRIADTNAIVEAAPLPDIHGYPQMLSLLFYHLLGNALLFQEAGAQPQIKIEYALVSGNDVPSHPSAQPGASYHRLTFRDNGIGFEPEYSEKIFGMFQRLHPQGTYKGTGMGLAICQKVAEAHQGFIIAESNPGAGATFHCYLQDVEAA